jgi:GAF domain-containing protein
VTSPLQQVVDDARTAFGAAACSVATLDEDEGELTYRVASGAGAAEIVGVRLPVTRGIAGWVAVSGQALAVSDLHTDTRFAADVAESTRYVPRAMLVTPIVGAEGVIGVLSVLDRDTRRAEAAHDLALAGSYAASAGAALGAVDAELPAELRPVADLLRAADPQQAAALRAGLRRLLDEQT